MSGSLDIGDRAGKETEICLKAPSRVYTLYLTAIVTLPRIPPACKSQAHFCSSWQPARHFNPSPVTILGKSLFWNLTFNQPASADALCSPPFCLPRATE